MNKINQEPKVQAKKINIPKVGKLFLSDKVKEYIDCLHKEIGAVEWSGMLFYKIESGDIKTMKDMVFKSDFIYPRDIGTHTYTETIAGADVAEAYDVYEDGIESSIGLIHSHNNFSTFFSGTDIQELEDNAKLYNYYISLIVNFDGKYCAKIAFPGRQKATSVTTLTDSDGKPYEFKNDTECDVIFIGDLDVEYNKKELVIEEWLDLKIKALKEAKKPKPMQSISNYGYNKQELGLPFYEEKFPMRTESKFIPKQKTPTGKDLLAGLIVFSGTDELYTDKTIFIAQDLRSNCEDDVLGEMTLEILRDEFPLVYTSIFGDEDSDEDYLKNLKSLLAELMIYDKLYSNKKFFMEFKSMVEASIEEVEIEIKANKII